MAAGIEFDLSEPERERDMYMRPARSTVQTINNANFDAQLRLRSKLAQVCLQADMYTGGTAESFTAAPGWKGQDVGR